eukprot:6932289-Ditylum_brightwellii.AAC.1
MLVDRVYPVMKTYRLEGGTVGYKGNVLNIEQDIKGLVMSLPARVNQLPIIIVRKRNSSSTPGFKDFRVRCQVIKDWLTFLSQHNPHYSDITIDAQALEELPVDGTIERDTMVINEEELVNGNDQNSEIV